MITVIASAEIKPGHRDDFLEEFRRIVPVVRDEVGCIEYGPTVDTETDIEIQYRNENLVTIVEQWESVDALKSHLVADHMTSYRERVKDFVANVQIRILEPA